MRGDYYGSFFVKFKNFTKGVLNKFSVAVYNCLHIKAINLDFVSDYTIQAFIVSLKHFFGRRGKCASIMSDNSKIFTMANTELQKSSKNN